MCKKKLLTSVAKKLHLLRYIMADEIEYNQDTDLCAVEDEPGVRVPPSEAIEDQSRVVAQGPEDPLHPSEVIIGNYNLEQIGQAQTRLIANVRPVSKPSILDRFFGRWPK